MTDTEAIKGRVLEQLITGDLGVGKAQYPVEFLSQSCVPQHLVGAAQDAIMQLINDPTVPVHSPGGHRDVVQVSSANIEKAKRLANEWHPEREPGDSFDPTDISDDTEERVAVLVGYDSGDRAFNVLDDSPVTYSHAHGGCIEGLPDDKHVFLLTGEPDVIEEVEAELEDATKGDAAMSRKKRALKAVSAAI